MDDYRAGRGLGRAFAQETVSRGDSVIATVRKLDHSDPLFQHENVLPVIMDVTEESAVREAVKAGMERFGRIDILINNAGFGMSGAFEEVSEAELRTLFETDYFGVVHVTRAVIPVMREQGSGMILISKVMRRIRIVCSFNAYCLRLRPVLQS